MPMNSGRIAGCWPKLGGLKVNRNFCYLFVLACIFLSAIMPVRAERFREGSRTQAQVQQKTDARLRQSKMGELNSAASGVKKVVYVSATNKTDAMKNVVQSDATNCEKAVTSKKLSHELIMESIVSLDGNSSSKERVDSEINWMLYGSILSFTIELLGIMLLAFLMLKLFRFNKIGLSKVDRVMGINEEHNKNIADIARRIEELHSNLVSKVTSLLVDKQNADNEKYSKLFRDRDAQVKSLNEALTNSFTTNIAALSKQIDEFRKYLSQLGTVSGSLASSSSFKTTELSSIRDMLRRMEILLSGDNISNVIQKINGQVEKTQSFLSEVAIKHEGQLRGVNERGEHYVAQMGMLIASLTEKCKTLEDTLNSSVFIHSSELLQKELKCFVSDMENNVRLKSECENLRAALCVAKERSKQLSDANNLVSAENKTLQQQTNDVYEALRESENQKKSFESKCTELSDNLKIAESQLSEKTETLARINEELVKRNHECEAAIQAKSDCLLKIEALSVELSAAKSELVNLPFLQAQVENYRKQDQMCIPEFLRGNSLLKDFECSSTKALLFRNSLGCLVEMELLGGGFDFNDKTFFKSLELVGRHLNDYIRFVSSGCSEQYVYDQMHEMAESINKFARSITTPAPFTLFIPTLGMSFQTNSTISQRGAMSVEGVLNWGVKDSRNNYQILAKVI